MQILSGLLGILKALSGFIALFFIPSALIGYLFHRLNTKHQSLWGIAFGTAVLAYPIILGWIYLCNMFIEYGKLSFYEMMVFSFIGVCGNFLMAIIRRYWIKHNKTKHLQTSFYEYLKSIVFFILCTSVFSYVILMSYWIIKMYAARNNEIQF